MADVSNITPWRSSVSYDKSFINSPSNYTIAKADHEEEELKPENPHETSPFASSLLAANLIWIGHQVNEDQLAGAAIGNMIINLKRQII